jgi:hypothetical protein
VEEMREIKFRGKIVDNGEWVYGWYCKDEYGKTRIWRKDKYNCLEWFEVIPFSFGIPPTGVDAKVYWNDYDGSWCFECQKDVNPKNEKLSFFSKEGDCYDIEVIGNIHENQELLEAK